jgi:hypothetical protein
MRRSNPWKDTLLSATRLRASKNLVWVRVANGDTGDSLKELFASLPPAKREGGVEDAVASLGDRTGGIWP